MSNDAVDWVLGAGVTVASIFGMRLWWDQRCEQTADAILARLIPRGEWHVLPEVRAWVTTEMGWSYAIAFDSAFAALKRSGAVDVHEARTTFGPLPYVRMPRVVPVAREDVAMVADPED